GLSSREALTAGYHAFLVGTGFALLAALLGALSIRTALSAQAESGDEGISSAATAQPENS
ncbi:MAG TPA: hypothetical protein VH184_08480, partial [Dongiaceae bacterium]|nr:hypothetical protein [Dongiaceae bacterium]